MVPPEPGHCIEHGRKLSAAWETLENEIPGSCFMWLNTGFMMSDEENRLWGAGKPGANVTKRFFLHHLRRSKMSLCVYTRQRFQPAPRR
jgi:hypothetical protein